MAPIFEPIKNPYIVGNPIKGQKMFFGREDDFAYIKTKFSGSEEGGLIVLCGARRSGKTSVLFQIKDGRLGESFLPVLIDMQSMAIQSDDDFLRKIMELIGDAVPQAVGMMEEVNRSGKPSFEAFEWFIKNLIDALDGRRLLLAIDEYELIETHIDARTMSEHLLHMLANLIEHRNLFIVFTGSDNLEGRNKSYWNVFLSKALHRRISFLSRGDTMRLINEPVAGIVNYREGVTERIATLTAGQPFYTQVVCQSIVDHLNEARTCDVAVEMLEAVVEDVIENPLPQMIFHWNAFSPLEKLTMAVVAELSRDGAEGVTAEMITSFARDESIGYQFDENALNKGLEKLFHGDMLNKATDGEIFSFKMGMWQKWIARMHSVWQVIDEFEKEQVDLDESGLIRVKRGFMTRRAAMFLGTAIVVIVVLGLTARDRIVSALRGDAAQQVVLSGGLQAADARMVADLRVISKPAGAEIWFGDRILEITPASVRVPSGSIQLELRKQGFRTFVDSLNLADGESRDLTYDLIENTGRVVVTSVPPGAAIAVDGESTSDVTPATLEFRESHLPEIRMSMSGYNSRVFPAVRIFADSTVTLEHKFSRQRALLNVYSTPSGAGVLIDGEYEGNTPHTIESIEFGTHTLVVRLNGYYDHSRSITIPVAGNRIDVSLERLPGGYIAMSVIPGAKMIVDDVTVRESDQHHVLSHAVGEARVRFEHHTFGSWEETVVVTSGDTVRVEHDFGRQ